MFGRMIIALLALLPITSAQAAIGDSAKPNFLKSQKAPLRTVKVLIVHDQPGVVFEVKGRYRIIDPHAQSLISSRYIGKRKFIEAFHDGIRWGEEFPGVHQLVFVPDSPETTMVVDGSEYRGAIYVYDIGGTISIVNEIDVDSFLNSTLTQLFKEPLSDETLAAIAIAARTNTLYQAENPPTNYWAIDGRKIGYQGTAVAIPGSPIERSIQLTRNMIITRDDGKNTIGYYPAQWGLSTGGSADKAMFARITVFDAEEMAKKGNHAAQILQKAFPNTKVTLME